MRKLLTIFLMSLGLGVMAQTDVDIQTEVANRMAAGTQLEQKDIRELWQMAEDWGIWTDSTELANNTSPTNNGAFARADASLWIWWSSQWNRVGAGGGGGGPFIPDNGTTELTDVIMTENNANSKVTLQSISAGNTADLSIGAGTLEGITMVNTDANSSVGLFLNDSIIKVERDGIATSLLDHDITLRASEMEFRTGYNFGVGGEIIYSVKLDSTGLMQYGGDYSTKFLDNTFVTKSWVLDQAGIGGGNVYKSGVPTVTQIATWTNDSTIQGVNTIHGTSNIAGGTIQTNSLATGAVTQVILATDAVVTLKIGARAVTYPKMPSLAAWQIAGRNASGSGDFVPFTIAGLATKSSPSAGDWMLGVSGSDANAPRRFDVMQLLNSEGFAAEHEAALFTLTESDAADSMSFRYINGVTAHNALVFNGASANDIDLRHKHWGTDTESAVELDAGSLEFESKEVTGNLQESRMKFVYTGMFYEHKRIGGSLFRILNAYNENLELFGSQGTNPFGGTTVGRGMVRFNPAPQTPGGTMADGMLLWYKAGALNVMDSLGTITDLLTPGAPPTHTGDVQGDVDLTIQVDAVDIPMLSATGTADATTFLRGDNTWAVATGATFNGFVTKGGTDQAFSDSDVTHISGLLRVLAEPTADADYTLNQGVAGQVIEFTNITAFTITPVEGAGMSVQGAFLLDEQWNYASFTWTTATNGIWKVEGHGFGGQVNVTTNAATAYATIATDEYVRNTSSSAVTDTIPAFADVPYKLGHILVFRRDGTGSNEIIPAAGVTFNTADTTAAGKYIILAQYREVSFVNVGTNSWDASGVFEVGEGHGAWTNVTLDASFSNLSSTLKFRLVVINGENFVQFNQATIRYDDVTAVNQTNFWDSTSDGITTVSHNPEVRIVQLEVTTSDRSGIAMGSVSTSDIWRLTHDGGTNGIEQNDQYKFSDAMIIVQ